MRKKLNWLCLALFITLYSAYGYAAQPVINNFHSDITVESSGHIDVREQITVTSYGRVIKHGIFRDFPTRYKTNSGARMRVKLNVISAKIDGVRAPFHLENIDYGKRIYIGSKNDYVPPGKHTYTLHYRVGQLIGYFADHDELYWNVTGNGWGFPIERASTAVRLPPAAFQQVQWLKAFTGYRGDRGMAYIQQRDENNGLIYFQTTHMLLARQGLTIAIAWPSGIVAKPSMHEQLNSHLPLILIILGMLITSAYFYIAWYIKGRDPKMPSPYPLFTPPDDLSPCAMRYIVDMKPDKKMLTIALINMGVKGFIKITQQDKDNYHIEQISDDSSQLSAEEHVLAQKLGLHKVGDSFDISDKYSDTVKDAVKAVDKSLRQNLGTRYFHRNLIYYFIGAGLTLLGLTPFFLADNPNMQIFIFGIIFISAIGSNIITIYRRFISRSSPKKGQIFSAIFAALILGFIIIMFIAQLFAAVDLKQLLAFRDILDASSMASLFYVCVFYIILNGVFYHILPQYTGKGITALQHIEGYKLFLNAAEKDRLNFSNPPSRTPALFEQGLPYAFALNVEQQWSEQFASILDAMQSGPNAYQPSWYIGTTAFSVNSFNNFSNSFASTLSSSATSPSSSGGGGGFSGGGGGGGGGGGW